MYRRGDRVRLKRHISDETEMPEDRDLVWIVEDIKPTAYVDVMAYYLRNAEGIKFGPLFDYDFSRVYNGLRIFMEMV